VIERCFDGRADAVFGTASGGIHAACSTQAQHGQPLANECLSNMATNLNSPYMETCIQSCEDGSD